MVTAYMFLKETAPFKGDIKKLLKKPLLYVPLLLPSSPFPFPFFLFFPPSPFPFPFSSPCIPLPLLSPLLLHIWPFHFSNIYQGSNCSERSHLLIVFHPLFFLIFPFPLIF